MPEIKHPDPDKSEFMANGKLYKIEGSLSVERYAELQILELEMGYGLSFRTIASKLEELAKLIDKQSFGKAAILLNDIRRGLVKMREKEPTAIKICALFMNTENEDRTVFTQDLITSKMNDWNTEGISMDYFFGAAFSLVNGYLEIYKKFIQLTSDWELNLVNDPKSQ